MVNKKSHLMPIALSIVLALLVIAGCAAPAPVSPPVSTPPPQQQQPSPAPAIPPPVATPQASGTPDIIISDVWADGDTIYYKAKNIGTAKAPGNHTYVYRNNMKGAQDYIEALAPGEERMGSFTGVGISIPQKMYTSLLSETENVMLNQILVKVCADAANAVTETNENNNCVTRIFGDTFTVDFKLQAQFADWYSNFGHLRTPIPHDSGKGFWKRTTFIMEDGSDRNDVFMTYVPTTSGGWLEGRYSDQYIDANVGDAKTWLKTPFTMPIACKFSALVGFAREAPSDAKARFMIGYTDQLTSNTTYLPAITASKDGKLDKYEVDLSSLAGKKISLVLRVEGQGPDNPAIWIDPKLAQ